MSLCTFAMHFRTLILAGLGTFALSVVLAAEFYVAPNGSDSNAGRARISPT
jgi:hypothetical protein